MICPFFGFNGAKSSTIGFHSYERHDHADTLCSNGAKPSAIGFSTLCDNMTSMPEPRTGDICKKTKIKMLDKINFIILHQN